MTPTNYNYDIDSLQLRWKTVDILQGAVNVGAIQTYDFRYYYYDAYYTYTNDKIYTVSSFSMDQNKGTSCQSYYKDIVNRNANCIQFAEPYTVTNAQVTGLVIGIIFLGFGVAVCTFGLIEVRLLTKRNQMINQQIFETKQKLVAKVAELIVKDSAEPKIYSMYHNGLLVSIGKGNSDLKKIGGSRQMTVETNNVDEQINDIMSPRDEEDGQTSDRWHYNELV